MKCIFDENMPPKLAQALNFLEGKNGIEVKHMTEIVVPSTSDEDWIRLLGEDSSNFVITKDNRIKKNQAEILAWKESNLTIIFLQDSWFSLDFWDICWKFLKVWPELKKSIIRSSSRKTMLLHIQGRIEEIENKPIIQRAIETKVGFNS